MIFLELRSGARAQVFMLSKNIASPWLLRAEQSRYHGKPTSSTTKSSKSTAATTVENSTPISTPNYNRINAWPLQFLRTGAYDRSCEIVSEVDEGGFRSVIGDAGWKERVDSVSARDIDDFAPPRLAYDAWLLVV